MSPSEGGAERSSGFGFRNSAAPLILCWVIRGPLYYTLPSLPPAALAHWPHHQRTTEGKSKKNLASLCREDCADRPTDRPIFSNKEDLMKRPPPLQDSSSSGWLGLLALLYLRVHKMPPFRARQSRSLHLLRPPAAPKLFLGVGSAMRFGDWRSPPSLS